MTVSIFLTAPPCSLEKIFSLRRLLLREKGAFEQVANHVENEDLRRTILTLAQNNNQYACELSSQIRSMGGMPTSDDETARIEEPLSDSDENELDDLISENDILSFCNSNENKMVSAYRAILNETTLYEGLRDMIRYQLNGILYSFMQIKLLNSLRLT